MQGMPAPEIAGINEWINVKTPPAIKKMRGRVVIVNFWSYSSVNCIRILPHINKWSRKYSKSGLSVIGIHSPGYGFEKDATNVKMAAKKHGIKYPIALDNGMKTWEAYNNRFWPCYYIIDSKGKIRHIHAGEGAYAETELWILKLLAEMGINIKAKIERTQRAGYNINTTLEASCGSASKKTQLGNSAENGRFSDPGKHDIAKIYLDGEWKQEKEYLENSGKGHLCFVFRAKKMNIVMAPAGQSARVKILIDNQPVQKKNFGADTKPSSSVVVDRPDVYNLYSSENFGTHEVKLIADKPVRIFSFAFG